MLLIFVSDSLELAMVDRQFSESGLRDVRVVLRESAALRQ